ncbi:hypothetical protein JNW88_18315 [Micromonospora sp. ATA32]|nr:hypothetical protein [Micromonospora sp. ATA32]
MAVTPLAVHREVESYDLTITHLDRAGKTTGNYSTTLVGLQTFTFQDPYDADGVAQVRLPKGRYGLNSYVFELGEAGGVSALAQPELVVDRNKRITVDARKARPVVTTVPQRSATPLLVDIGANFFGVDASYSLGLWSFDFAGLSSGQLGRSVSAQQFVGTVSSQWADGQAPSSPYLYALSEGFPGRMPTGFVRHYRSTDLATVVHRFRGGYPGMSAERAVFPELEWNTGGSAVILPTAVPGQRVEHYNTGHVRWGSELDFGVRGEDGWLEPKAVLISTPTAYRDGRTVTETWNSAPYGPSFPTPRWPEQSITRTVDTIFLDVPVHSDADGHPGGSLNDTARTALYRNGTLVGESEYAGFGQFTVPGGAANYRLETSATRGFTDLSTEVTTAWTFRSRHVADDDPVRLPAMAVRFAPALRLDNSAPAGRAFVIPVQVQRQPGAPAANVAALTVEVSYDGGKTWRKAGLDRQGQGWAATVRHPAGAGYASLRATARDTAGNTVTERIIQAYRLR